jgi:NADH-quinone oxidoreductase subunit E
MITQTVETNGTGSSSALHQEASPDEDAIQVSDDEIESAEPSRPTLTSGLPAFGGTFARSRPPAPPSMRPRTPSTSLPPRRSWLGSSLPPPSFPSQPPSERDPWILANKTLELGRANARISALEDQIAFRDARILSLEDRLEAAQQKIEELERKLDAAPLVAPSATVAAAKAAPVKAAPSAVTSVAATSIVMGPAVARTASKPAIAIPKPADVAKAAELVRATPARVDAALAQATAHQETAQQETAHQDAVQQDEEGAESVSSEAPELAGSSIRSDADDELASSAASPPTGPEDVRQIAGIGPRFEAALRKHGITRVSQIAAWSDTDVRQVAKALKIPKSRIVKGRWVEAAREMIGSRATSE